MFVSVLSSWMFVSFFSVQLDNLSLPTLKPEKKKSTFSAIIDPSRKLVTNVQWRLKVQLDTPHFQIDLK
ncbi:hypothetical protein VNO78_02801 [Psophocarpus tetragonolobus]|uniref:Uncharacterized protein n=1 Tax=Psophocarpus tetragonolobus TaxID=3891 RepID=A0AAN9T0F5_PSOTE